MSISSPWRSNDGAADFPLHPLNLVADANAVLGFLYIHTNYLDAVSLPSDPTTSPAYQGTHGDSSYYFFPTEHLPLFAPLRQLGVPEPLIDVVEPFFRVLVEMGYDRSIPPWEPTPARLIPPLDPAKVATDLVNAIGEGVNNALALVGVAPLSSIPAPVTLAAPVAQSGKTAISPQVTSSSTLTQTRQETSTGTAVTNTVTTAGLAESTTTQEADPPAATEIAKADISPQVTATETVTEASQMTSTKTAANAAEATEVSTEPAPANAPDATASASTPKPAKPARQPAKPRPVVHDSLGVGQQLPDLPHRGGSGPTTRTADAPTGARSPTSSSSAASATTSSSSGGGAPGDDDHDS
jgi:hypothetical protein